MTIEESIQLLQDNTFRVLVVGITDQNEIAVSVTCTREETLKAIKAVEPFRLFYLTESEKDAAYLKNESKKL